MVGVRTQSLVVGAVAALALALVAGKEAAKAQSAPAAPAGAASAQPALSPETLAQDKSTFEAVCSSCHDAAVVAGQPRSRKEWEAVIDRMYNQGLVATDEQVAQVLDYLTATYGPPKA
jgi:cytochrome c5